MVVRRIAVSLSLLGMLAAVVGLGVSREPPRMVADTEPDGKTEGPAAAASNAPVDDANAPDAAVETSATAVVDPEAAPIEPGEPIGLTVVGASWEVLAPGVLANGGRAPAKDSQFSAAGLDVHFSPAKDAADLETQLGLGGEAKGGADIALMPLPTFVASYERLRALSPQVFFVVAWSRGRDALTGDVNLVRKPPSKGHVKLGARAGSAEALLGLFALSWAGVEPDRVDVIDPLAPMPKRAVKSLRRTKSRQVDARKVFLSTADATHLIPIVAIAPRGVLVDKRAAVAAFSRVWLQGTEGLAADPAAAARLLAAEAGAPKAVDLIDALGWLEFADLAESAAAVGLSGRRASTLDTLFARTWRLWRRSGLIATPPPRHVPLSAMVIAELAGESKVGVRRDPTPAIAPPDASAKPVLVHRVRGDSLSTQAEVALVNEAGFLADVFARSPIRITVPRSRTAAARIASSAAQRFGLDADRFVVVTRRRGSRGAAAIVEVLPAV
ncbi:MAG: hypothetical protein AAF721_30155 [Myxococcota bacterium]